MKEALLIMKSRSNLTVKLYRNKVLNSRGALPRLNGLVVRRLSAC